MAIKKLDFDITKLIPIIVRRVLAAVPTPERGIQGVQGQTGDKGSDGIGRPGKEGEDGLDGLTGDKGETGDTPEHQVSNGEVRFKQPDGSWGAWIRATGRGRSDPQFSGYAPTFNTYTPITESEFHVIEAALKTGHNIFGVQNVGVTTVFVPKRLDKGVILTINDETGQASTNNITVIVEEN